MYHNLEAPSQPFCLYHCFDGEGKHQFSTSTLESQTSEEGYELKYSFVTCVGLL